MCGEVFDKANEREIMALKEYDKKVGNPEFYNLPEAELQRWMEAVNPIYEMWIAEMESLGLPGKAIFEDTRRLVEKYSK